jgi:hypothetical protein
MPWTRRAVRVVERRLVYRGFFDFEVLSCSIAASTGR